MDRRPVPRRRPSARHRQQLAGRLGLMLGGFAILSTVGVLVERRDEGTMVVAAAPAAVVADLAATAVSTPVTVAPTPVPTTAVATTAAPTTVTTQPPATTAKKVPVTTVAPKKKATSATTAKKAPAATVADKKVAATAPKAPVTTVKKVPATTTPSAATSAPPAATSAPATTRTWTAAEVTQVIRDVWPDELEDKAIAIATRETRLIPTAHNWCCHGIFAIYFEAGKRLLATLGITSIAQLYDPVVNSTAAYAIYQAAGWDPWTL
jgi:hypothetical protein